MAYVLRSSYDVYEHLTKTLSDPRSANLFLVGGSPLPLIILISAYCALCRYGPRWMESRKEFELKPLITFYNFVQVTTCTYVGCSAAYDFFWKFKFNFTCQPIDYSNSEYGRAEVYYTYVYFLLKVLDLCDTIFIILRKKNDQLTFLHCYHHCGMLFLTNLSSKWFPGGPAICLGVLNTLVHSVMYSYYFLTAFKPELKKSMWWKKHITQLQIAQFCFLSVIFSRALLSKDCDYPKLIAFFMVCQNLCMLTLFSYFYHKRYVAKKFKLQ